MPTIEIIGLIAATLTTMSFLPQAYKAFRYKSTTDISLTMYSILFIGLVLWLIYGIYHQSLPIILSNAITGVLALAILILKIKYR